MQIPKVTLFDAVISKKEQLKEFKEHYSKIGVEDSLETIFPNYTIKPKIEGREIGAIIEDKNGAKIYLKVSNKVSLTEKCLAEVFYLSGIGAKTDYIETRNGQTILISRDILKSKGNKKLIDDTIYSDGAQLRNISDFVGFAFLVGDIGQLAQGPNNVLITYHQWQNDLQLKVVDFDEPELSYYKAMSQEELKENIKGLLGLLKIKLDKNGKPLSGKERKVINPEEVASLEQVIYYSFKVGLEKLFAEKGVTLSGAEIKNLLSATINTYTQETEALDKQYQRAIRDFKNNLSPFLYGRLYEVIRENDRLECFFDHVNPIEPIEEFIETLCIEEEDKQKLVQMLEIGNQNIIEIKKCKDKIEAIKQNVFVQIKNLLPPNITLSDDIMGELYFMFQYKENVLEPRILEPLRQISEEELNEAKRLKIRPSSFVKKGLEDINEQHNENKMKHLKYSDRKEKYESILEQYENNQESQNIIKDKMIESWFEDFKNHHLRYKGSNEGTISSLYNLLDNNYSMKEIFSKSSRIACTPQEDDKLLKDKAKQVLNEIYKKGI
jgi:hypothetical protein